MPIVATRVQPTVALVWQARLFRAAAGAEEDCGGAAPGSALSLCGLGLQVSLLDSFHELLQIEILHFKPGVPALQFLALFVLLFQQPGELLK